MKVDVEYLRFMWPMRHFLISCGEIDGKSDIIAVSFCMPVSKEPPLIACAIGTKAYSSELIERTREFIVNVPTKDLQAAIAYCGYHSGREVDKFRETGLTPKAARRVRAPIIEECVAQMECRVVQQCETGDKHLFVGEVIEAYADETVARGEKKAEYAAGDFPSKVYSIRSKKL